MREQQLGFLLINNFSSVNAPIIQSRLIDESPVPLLASRTFITFTNENSIAFHVRGVHVDALVAVEASVANLLRFVIIAEVLVALRVMANHCYQHSQLILVEAEHRTLQLNVAKVTQSKKLRVLRVQLVYRAVKQTQLTVLITSVSVDAERWVENTLDLKNGEK